MSGRSGDITALLSFLDDWAPVLEAAPTDGAAVPVRGLGAIAEMLEALVDRYPTSPAREVSEVKESDDLLTEWGRAHGPSAFGAFQQGSSDVAFQPVDLDDERRLGDAETFGGLA